MIYGFSGLPFFYGFEYTKLFQKIKKPRKQFNASPFENETWKFESYEIWKGRVSKSIMMVNVWKLWKGQGI